MADKTHATGAAGKTPTADQPDNVRNVVLVGHSGAGKTTLAEALLAVTGTIQREGRVEDGTTASDFDEVEVRQRRSVNLTLVPFEHAGVKVNLLDTPGYADFTGDLRAGLRAADAALFTVSAADGVDGLTQMLWDECAKAGTPRAVVITKIDHQRGDFDEALAACRDAFGDSVAPLYLPVTDGQGGVRGLIGLLSQRFYDYSGGSRAERDIAAADADRVDEATVRADRGDHPGERGRVPHGHLPVRRGDRRQGPDRGPGDGRRPRQLLPGARVASPHHIGMEELLEVMTQAFPSPAEHPLPAVTTVDGKPVSGLTCDPAGPLLAEVVKTVSDPYVGRVSLVRVFSGHAAPRRHRARLRPRPGRARARRPRRGRAGRRDHLAARQAAAHRLAVHRRRHLRGGQAQHGRDRRHAVGQGPAAADGVLGHARAAAAGGDPGQVQGRRGQDVAGPGPARGRGPDPAAGEQRRDPPAGAVVHGRGARRPAA